MSTKFISGLGNVQSPLIKKNTAYGSKVSATMDMLRHDQSRHVSPTVLAVIQSLQKEGWDAQPHADGIQIQDEEDVYIRTEQWLKACDYSDVPEPLANDITDAMRAQGFCM